MATLWIDRKDSELRMDGESLVPYMAGTRGRPVPLRILERVIIVGNCHLQAAALAALAAAGVAVAIVNPRDGQRRAWLMGPGHGGARLRLSHLAAAMKRDFARREAHGLIMAKVRRQRRLVCAMLARRPDAAYDLSRAVQILDTILSTLEEAEGLTRASLRGLEGTASRITFETLAAVLPPVLEFSGRKRRPPPDPVNAALSLAYTILHHRAAQVAWAHGLDPLIGFFHEPSHGRESLAADLMEPWRPPIEEWVWRLFADRKLRKEHFHQIAGGAQKRPGCYLGKAGRRIFYESFENALAPLGRALRLQVRALVRRIREHADDA